MGGAHNPPGYGVQVTPKGTITFFVRIERDGKRAFPSLGRWPATTIAQARDRAWAKLRGHSVDHAKPVFSGEHRPLSEQLNPQQWGALSQLLSAYVWDLKQRGRRSWKNEENELKKDCSGAIGEKPAREVVTEDIAKILKQVWDRGAGTQSNRLRSHLHAAYELGLKYDTKISVENRQWKFGITHNPVSRIEREMSVERARNRCLSLDELAHAWANPHLPPYQQYMFRLIVLTFGQRPGEIIQAPLSAVDFDQSAMITRATALRTR